MYQYVLFEMDAIMGEKRYPGIAQLLHDLKARGVMMAVLSEQPKESVSRILREAEIEEFFSVVSGCEEGKASEFEHEMLKDVLSELRKKAGRRFKKEKTLLVGNRRRNLECAAQMEIASVAVMYACTSEREISVFGPEDMAESVEQLEEIITGEPLYYKYRTKNAFAKTMEILVPFLLFWALELLVYNAGYVLVGRYIPVLAGDKNQLSVWLNAAAAISTWPLLAKCYASSYFGDTSPVITGRNRRLVKRDAVLILSYAVALGLGLNMLATWVQMFRISEAYEQVAGIQYSVSLPVGLVIYGVLTPFTEEVLFRGIIHNRIRKYFPLPVTVFAGALIFGCFHGNIVQMVYALLMGMALAIVYEAYGRYLAAPVLFHCGANAVVYLLSKGKAFSAEKMPVLYGVALLAVALAITGWYIQRLKKKSKRR